MEQQHHGRDRGQREAGGGLTGNYWIRPVQPAFKQATKLFERPGHYFELKGHALKLRYWPDGAIDRGGGVLLDLDWEWIKALPNEKVGELRIADHIAGHDNLRLIFYVGGPGVQTPLPIIWILAVLQKKRTEFTSRDIDVFHARRVLVDERFYKNREFL